MKVYFASATIFQQVRKTSRKRRDKMLTKDQEQEELVNELDSSEAGVAEVLEMYRRVEEIYVAASEVVASNEDSYTDRYY